MFIVAIKLNQLKPPKEMFKNNNDLRSIVSNQSFNKKC